jgi:hypothetical protein
VKAGRPPRSIPAALAQRARSSGRAISSPSVAGAEFRKSSHSRPPRKGKPSRISGAAWSLIVTPFNSILTGYIARVTVKQLLER